MRWSTQCLFIPFLLCFSPLYASSFEYSETIQRAYQEVLSLRVKEADLTLRRIKMRTPDNLAVYHLENYQDFLRLFTSEDPVAYDQLKKNEELRIAKIQSGDPRSPYYLYTQADIRMQWALLKFRFEEPFAAFMDLSRAYKLLRRNQELFPGFLPNQKNLGLLHALAGTIPDSYRWGAKLLGGISGTVNQGKKELERVLWRAKGQHFFFEAETILLYSYVLLHLSNEGDKAWQILVEASLDTTKNPLYCYVMAGVAMQTGRNEAAIRILETRSKDSAYLAFPQLEYMLGAARLRKLDPAAAQAFHTFLAQHKGKNGIKDTYQKLAWYAWILKKEEEGYRRYMQRVIRSGQAVSGADKNALKEAQSADLPHPVLLKARLLFDGGYLNEGLRLMYSIEVQDLKTAAHKLEYHYRMGRILHGLKEYPKALASYQHAIQMGRYATHYLACNAALQSGLIYEALNNPKEAAHFFELCLSIEPEDYRANLHQAAKAGLSRIEDKKN